MFEYLCLNNLFLVSFSFSFIPFIDGAATFFREDAPYEPIEIKIPLDIWQQALKPTPVLKSAATIVLPIHVNDDLYEDTIDENEVTDENEVSDDNNLSTNDEETENITSKPAEDVVISTETSSIIEQQDTDVVNEELIETNSTNVVGQVIRFPCSCVEGQCGCCTGALLQTMNMKACGNISFVPEDFVFDVRMTMNNQTMVRRRVSASDPPPICFNPRRAPFVRVCAEISNIRIRNNNAYACLDINADIGGFDVYSASFRCFGLGLSGVQTGLKPKPVSSGPAPVSLFGDSNRDEEADDGPGLLDGITGGIFGGGDGDGGGLLGENGIFGGGSEGSDGDDDDGGPFGAIGDAFDGFGDFLDAR